MMQRVKELPIIMIREIGYSYPNGTEALKNINLNIFKGEIIGIMGKNGAGKTSLIRTFNGLIRPTYGTVYIDNENISSKSIATLSKKVGIIFQNPFHQLFSNSVEEEIKFSLKSFNLSKEEIQFKTDQILHEFFINLIKSERKKGKTIIIITHNVEFAYEYLPRTILMTDGQIIVDGPTKKVLNNEFLIKQTSLILPQIRQFNLVLQQNGFHEVEDILTKNEMIDYLRNLIKHKSSNI